MRNLAFLSPFILVGSASAQVVWVDWTSESSNSVSGVLPGSSITATITAESPTAESLALSNIGNTFDWTASWFTPPVANSDAIWISNSVANSTDLWRIQFSQPVTDPVFHFQGMERTYTFNSNIQLVSSSEPFPVIGSRIEGIRGFNDPGQVKGGDVDDAWNIRRDHDSGQRYC